MRKDRYNNFEELNAKEQRGVDFIIEKEARDADIAIIAIHGGKIEPGVTEITEIVAEEEFSYYSFLGKKKEDNGSLHITSTHFDEPEGLEFVEKHKTVVSVHGMSGKNRSLVMVGGLDKELKDKIKIELKVAGFSTIPAPPRLGGTSSKNICNRGSSGKGVQIEITRKLRNELMQDNNLMEKFADAIRRAIN